MGNWQARAYGLPAPDVSPVVQIFRVDPNEDNARKALVEHLRGLGEGSWGAAMRYIGEDEEAYIRAYRRSELLFGSADAIRNGATAIEFEDARYELFHFNPVENGA